MAAVMTKEWLVKHCKERGLYQTPYLNDRLYLQCQAFCDIQNLEEYTGVKLLYLEENCLESMNGIQPLKQLQCLYLRRNFIKSIDYLDELLPLDTLDIREVKRLGRPIPTALGLLGCSQNYIERLENLSKCLNLRVLVVSHNQLQSIESVAHLTCCPSIMILDLSHNKLVDGEGVLEITLALPRLAVLYLSGNPCVSTIPHYRKKIIGNLKKLTHLDDRPVFWDDRLYAEAWLRGGQEAETAERDRVRTIRAEEETKQFESMRRMREQSMEQRLHVVCPNMLQFDPSELGEDEPESCPVPDKSHVQSHDDIDTNQVCSENLCPKTPPGETHLKVECRDCSEKVEADFPDHGSGEDKPIGTLVRQSQQKATRKAPENIKSSSSTNIEEEMQTGWTAQYTADKLETNPLFNDGETDSLQEEQKLWPRAKQFMISPEFQSICLPEWNGSETHSYPNVRNNTLFSEATAEYGDSESQPDGGASNQCWPPDHDMHTRRRRQGHGRDALASLAVPEMEPDINPRSSRATKEEDNFIRSLQAMNELDKKALVW